MTWLSPCGLDQCGHIPVIFQVACALATGYSAHPWASPLRAAASGVQICSRQICHSPPVTYFCKLLELPSLAAFLQLELFRV
ncbi:hypothetical protein DU209_18800 [Salmonella enterica subsp. enterica serovar Lomalinda]|nr:hypothetical protein [Salmonella enterica subsp. enterica serovar Lomalinda]